VSRGEKMENNDQEQILFILKALADESRMLMLHKLQAGEITVGDLAQRLELSEPTVSHHLTRLREAGLVTLRTAGNQRFYRTNPTGLAKFKKLAADIENLTASAAPEPRDDSWIAALGFDEADQLILRGVTRNGQLLRIPAQQKKMVVILRWLATLFQAERLYTEPEVNEVLKAVYAEDYVSLRRGLVDFGYLRRERGGGKYWLAPAVEQVS
jgi:predicted transcriptional regulator